ncbi:YigZ family protein [Francisella sp. Scap27]|uniref:YigZ family protein n=1 Tax=Francisella sp. Scap27 TaxID=2589986 RepID=UPI0015BCCB15|nr:YigZ family protein [Francisella sp. Scap27]QLE78980.1 YigZ family protein [Francisella sp. Scap27]
MNSYKTISKHIQFEIEPIKKSRFIAYLFKVESEQNALDHINKLKAEFPTANHHCWAYALADNNQFRFSDDGEPSGSAGKPIFSHIQGHDLTNVLVVIVRYFGGTKLGIGGLIRAYGQATKKVIESAEIIEVQPCSSVCIKYDYTETASVETVIKHFDAEIVSQSYDIFITMTVKINAIDKFEFIQEIINTTKGNAEIEDINQKL